MRARILSPLLVALLAVSPGTYAGSIVWTNAAGGKWSAAINWSPNQVPVSTDSAFITNNGTYTVTADGGPVVDSLTLGGATGLQSLVVMSSYGLALNTASVVNTNGVLGLSKGYLAGGPLTVNGAMNWTGGYIASGSMVTVATNGVLELAGVNGTDYRLYGMVTNAGIVRLVSGNLQLDSGCSSVFPQLVNLPGALVDLQADVSIDPYCPVEVSRHTTAWTWVEG
jgi:hypothetical protein